jgi:hypothetical protein
MRCEVLSQHTSKPRSRSALTASTKDNDRLSACSELFHPCRRGHRTAAADEPTIVLRGSQGARSYLHRRTRGCHGIWGRSRDETKNSLRTASYRPACHARVDCGIALLGACGSQSRPEVPAPEDTIDPVLPSPGPITDEEREAVPAPIYETGIVNPEEDMPRFGAGDTPEERREPRRVCRSAWSR